MKVTRLPASNTKIRYVPTKGYHPRNPLPRDPNGDLCDRFDSEWMKGMSRTKGQDFEWDVQLSGSGRRQFGNVTDKEHLNVPFDGRITHR